MSNYYKDRCPFCEQGIPVKNEVFQEHYDKTGTWKCPASGDSAVGHPNDQDEQTAE